MLEPREPLEHYLRDAARAGKYHSKGRFTLEPQRAYRKLLEHQFQDPHVYVLCLTSLAVARGASFISFHFSRKQTKVEFDGAALTTDELKQASSQVNSESLNGLATALRACLALNPQSLQVQSTERGRLSQLVVSPAGLWVESESLPSGEPDSSNRILFSRKTRFCWPSKFPERELLRQRCRYCPIPVLVDGRDIRAAIAIRQATVVAYVAGQKSFEFEGSWQLRHDSKGAHTALITFGEQAAAAVTFVVNGVSFEGFPLGERLAGARVFVHTGSLPTDLSWQKLTVSKPYLAIENFLRREVARVHNFMMGELAERRAKASEAALEARHRPCHRLFERGRLLEAIDRARPLAAASPRSELAIESARWHHLAGQLQQAREAYLRADSSASRIARMRALQGRAMLEADCGELSAAQQAADELHELVDVAHDREQAVLLAQFLQGPVDDPVHAMGHDAMLLANGLPPGGLLSVTDALWQVGQVVRQSTLDGKPLEKAECLLMLALLQALDGRNLEASDSASEALAIYRRVWGRGHPEWTAALNLLASTLPAEEALELFLQAWHAYESSLGTYHPETRATKRLVATAWAQAKEAVRRPELQQWLGLTKPATEAQPVRFTVCFRWLSVCPGLIPGCRPRIAVDYPFVTAPEPLPFYQFPAPVGWTTDELSRGFSELESTLFEGSDLQESPPQEVGATVNARPEPPSVGRLDEAVVRERALRAGGSPHEFCGIVPRTRCSIRPYNGPV